MTTWVAVVVGGLACLALKLAGFVVPTSWLSGRVTARITALLPVALLSALVAVQAFTGPGGRLVLDARLAAVAVALVLLWRRANFLVVVVSAAAVAALLRWLGWAA